MFHSVMLVLFPINIMWRSIARLNSKICGWLHYRDHVTASLVLIIPNKFVLMFQRCMTNVVIIISTRLANCQVCRRIGPWKHSHSREFFQFHNTYKQVILITKNHKPLNSLSMQMKNCKYMINSNQNTYPINNVRTIT